MTNHATFDEEDHVVGDVRGEIRDAFKALSDAEKLDGQPGRPRILVHLIARPREHGLVQFVDPLIGTPHLAAELRILVPER